MFQLTRSFNRKPFESCGQGRSEVIGRVVRKVGQRGKKGESMKQLSPSYLKSLEERISFLI